jgi:hypothetical protein
MAAESATALAAAASSAVGVSFWSAPPHEVSSRAASAVAGKWRNKLFIKRVVESNNARPIGKFNRNLHALRKAGPARLFEVYLRHPLKLFNRPCKGAPQDCSNPKATALFFTFAGPAQ